MNIGEEEDIFSPGKEEEIFLIREGKEEILSPCEENLLFSI